MQYERRSFFVDALRCPSCSTPMVVLALISDPHVVAKILRHLQLPTEPPPLAPANHLFGLDPSSDPVFPEADPAPDTSADDADPGAASLTRRRASSRPPP